MHAVEIAYEQGILKSRHITRIQRWALSYYLWDKTRILGKRDTENWKNQLFIHDRPTFEAIYNPKEDESTVIDENGNVVDNEQGLNDPNEIESILRSLSGQLKVADGQLANGGEWV